MHVQDRSGHGMIRVFRMYHVDYFAECVIKIVITAIERERQLIADAPCQKGRMMFVFADYLAKGPILIQDLVGVIEESVCITKRQTNNSGQMVRFLRHPVSARGWQYPISLSYCLPIRGG